MRRKSTAIGNFVDASQAFYEQAYDLVLSKEARGAFDINAEPKKLRDRYGRTTLGQRMLLARRLVQSGVRYVTVSHGGYDLHHLHHATEGSLGSPRVCLKL